MPKTARPWSLTSLREKLIKIGAKVVSHGRYVTFQRAEDAVPRQMFADILSLIARLRAPPTPVSGALRRAILASNLAAGLPISELNTRPLRKRCAISACPRSPNGYY